MDTSFVYDFLQRQGMAKAPSNILSSWGPWIFDVDIEPSGCPLFLFFLGGGEFSISRFHIIPIFLNFRLLRETNKGTGVRPRNPRSHSQSHPWQCRRPGFSPKRTQSIEVSVHEDGEAGWRRTPLQWWGVSRGPSTTHVSWRFWVSRGVSRVWAENLFCLQSCRSL